MSMSRLLVAACVVSIAGAIASPSAYAQTSVPPGQVSAFKDTSMVKPPAGSKVAIYEFEDLECPACSRAFPVVHAAVEHYKIPLLRHDFPLPMHQWSLTAAINARYMQDKISPALAEDYRRQVFASQYQIASKEDLHNFTVKFLQAHGQQMPFVVDPSGVFTKEVAADKALGEKIGLQETPTIFVVTQKGWVQVRDVMQLYSVIDAALAETGAAPAHSAAAKSTSAKATAHKTAASK
jgi:protein-disulfide isomerase